MTERWSRLRQTSVLRNDGMSAWQRATCGIIGCGVIGSRLAVEIVRSGATVWLCDFDRGEIHNTGTQAVDPGRLKIDSVIDACDRIRPGAATGQSDDVRHVGIGVLRRCDVLVDCTDDPRLAFGLTETANGLGSPLLRVAVDGSGLRELGPVLTSDPRNGGACQMCSRSFDDLKKTPAPTSCLGALVADRPPTLAGGGIASAITGMALLQLQKMITGNDLEQVRNREVILDLSNLQLMSMRLPRSESCISGHQEWQILEVPSAKIRTLGDVFAEIEAQLETREFTIEPYNHPLCIETTCDCGSRSSGLGTIWASPPSCGQCGAAMAWCTETQQTILSRETMTEFCAQDRTFVELGFPAEGAVFIARSDTKPTRHFVLT